MRERVTHASLGQSDEAKIDQGVRERAFETVLSIDVEGLLEIRLGLGELALVKCQIAEIVQNVTELPRVLRRARESLGFPVGVLGELEVSGIFGRSADGKNRLYQYGYKPTASRS